MDILHCDLNNFYASVEIRDNPSLRGKPVAVCGSIEDRAGIVLAKDYIAKSFGVKTGEAIWEAKEKCPGLTILPPRMHVYSEISKQVRAIYARYTDLVEPFGIDECWLDVTGSHILFGSSEDIAYEIKEAVKRGTGLTISVGASFSKILAKLGSDMKKPDAVTVLEPEHYREMIYPLAADEMVGIGSSTMKKLKNLGILTLGDLAETDPELLERRLGKTGLSLWRAVNGLDNEPVHEIGYAPVPKSVGNSTTLRQDLHSDEQVWQVMLSLSEDVCRRMRRDRLCAGGVSISVKTNDLSYREYQAKLEYPLCSALPLAKEGFKLFRERFDWNLPVRSVGIRGISLLNYDEGKQYSVFSDCEKIDRQETLSQVSDSLRKRFGNDIIYPARLKNDLYLGQEKINVFTNLRR
ncbi:MAG: DNA polymerase IV [Oscillospiraceae bacterium]|nr:DNA polymerase IV [Oscillospiraceae bacterium]